MAATLAGLYLLLVSPLNDILLMSVLKNNMIRSATLAELTQSQLTFENRKINSLARTLTDIYSDSTKVDTNYIQNISDVVQDAFLFASGVEKSNEARARD